MSLSITGVSPSFGTKKPLPKDETRGSAAYNIRLAPDAKLRTNFTHRTDLPDPNKPVDAAEYPKVVATRKQVFNAFMQAKNTLEVVGKAFMPVPAEKVGDTWYQIGRSEGIQEAKKEFDKGITIEVRSVPLETGREIGPPDKRRAEKMRKPLAVTVPFSKPLQDQMEGLFTKYTGKFDLLVKEPPNIDLIKKSHDLLAYMRDQTHGGFHRSTRSRDIQRVLTGIFPLDVGLKSPPIRRTKDYLRRDIDALFPRKPKP